MGEAYPIHNRIFAWKIDAPCQLRQKFADGAPPTLTQHNPTCRMDILVFLRAVCSVIRCPALYNYMYTTALVLLSFVVLLYCCCCAPAQLSSRLRDTRRIKQGVARSLFILSFTLRIQAAVYVWPRLVLCLQCERRKVSMQHSFIITMYIRAQQSTYVLT